MVPINNTEGLIDTNEIQNKYLNKYETIGLKEMQNVELQDRVDTKYIFSIESLPLVLQGLIENYRILDVEGTKYSDFETVYMDTDSYSFYMQHHNGKLNRYKLRYRTYLNTGQHYLETKFKTNKGRTKKRRFKLKKAAQFGFNEDEIQFINKGIDINTDNLNPSLWVYFTRLSFVHKTIPERLTIDLNLRFKKEDQYFKFPETIVAEVKQSRLNNRSDFVSLMKKFHIRKSPFSKYCIGTALVYDNLKKNKFKKIFLQLKKIKKNNGLFSNTL